MVNTARDIERKHILIIDGKPKFFIETNVKLTKNGVNKQTKNFINALDIGIGLQVILKEQENKSWIEQFDRSASESVQKDMDDMWVCDYCGSEEVRTEVFVDVNRRNSSSITNNDYYFCDTCGDDTKPITYFEFKERLLKNAEAIKMNMIK